MTRRRRFALSAAAVLGGLALTLAPAASAVAHPAEASAVLVTVNESSVDLDLQVPLSRYVLATDSTVQATTASVADHTDEISQYVLDHVDIAVGERMLTTTIEALSLTLLNDVPTIVIDAVAQLGAAPPQPSLDGDLTLTYSVVSERIATHDVYVSLVSDYRAGSLSHDEPVLLAVVTADQPTVTIERPTTSWWGGLLATVRLGIAHIAEGIDHLLFLAMLLLAGASVGARAGVSAARSPRAATPRSRLVTVVTRTALIATAFTVGHTLTLVLVTLGWLALPAVLVESLVAVSIIAAAAHAARPVVPRAELILAAGFGLVHGAAFAQTLVALQLEPAALVGALLGFTLGVELAQLIAIALIMPPLAWASSRRAFVPVRWVLAGLGALAGVAWLVATLVGTASVLDPAFRLIAEQPVVAYLVFVAAMAAIAWWGGARDRASAAQLT